MKNNNKYDLAVSDPPALALEFLRLQSLEDYRPELDQVIKKYPAFFNHLLEVINSDSLNKTLKVKNIAQAIELSGFDCISQMMFIQLIYRAINQYKVQGVEMQAFWQDSLRRAVGARLIAQMIGLDSFKCFAAGFYQDLGFILLFIKNPIKGTLWKEFRKREPEARLQMEQNIFKENHMQQLDQLMTNWKITNSFRLPLLHHHDSEESILSGDDRKVCDVLICADWLAAVYNSDDKSFVIDRCRKLLINKFDMKPYRADEILEALPDELDTTASTLGIEIGQTEVFSQILNQANEHLNKANVNYQELTARLEQALQERDRLADEINRELNLAREIQQSLLPKQLHDKFPITGINISAKILSGDFYDFIELDNGDIYFNLGDVSGKGVNAALLMAKASSLFRCLCKRVVHPGELLSEINNELCETSIHGMFVTMVAGRFTPSSGEICLVNAGNPPALLMTDGGLCREFEATSPPLGVISGTVYDEYSFNIGSDSLYIYSDGVTEGYTDENKELELSGLFKLLDQMDKTLLPADRLQSIVNQIDNGSQAIRDDITLLLLEQNRTVKHAKD